MTSVNKYRTYCTTESNYVISWGTSMPTTCPNNNAHTINSNLTTILQTVSDQNHNITNFPTTAFDELRVAERTGVIELKSIFGKSELRDIYTSNATGSIINNLGDSVYNVRTSNNGTDWAWLRSAERGRYVAGLQGEVGIAARLDTSISGNQEVKIGLFDDSNGLYFKHNSSGLSVCVLRAGQELSIPRSDWNIDKLDGTGPSKLNLNLDNGMIWQIHFTWYGFGSIKYRVNTTNPLTNVQSSWPCHVYFPGSNTSIQTPNLPMSVRVANNGTIAPLNVHVAGRQYSLLGKYTPLVRINSSYRIGKAINSTSIFIPIMSIRRKTGYLGNPIRLSSSDISSTTDQLIQIRVNTTLTGAVFGNLNDTNATDTAVELDTTASAVSGGIPIWTGMITGDSRSSSSSMLDISFDLPEYYILTLCAKAISATNGSTNAVLRWAEEW